MYSMSKLCGMADDDVAFKDVAQLCHLLDAEALEGAFSMKILVLMPEGAGPRPQTSVHVVPGPRLGTVEVATVKALAQPHNVDGILVGEEKTGSTVGDVAQAAEHIRAWLETT